MKYNLLKRLDKYFENKYVESDVCCEVEKIRKQRVAKNGDEKVIVDTNKEYYRFKKTKTDFSDIMRVINLEATMSQEDFYIPPINSKHSSKKHNDYSMTLESAQSLHSLRDILTNYVKVFNMFSVDTDIIKIIETKIGSALHSIATKIYDTYVQRIVNQVPSITFLNVAHDNCCQIIKNTLIKEYGDAIYKQIECLGLTMKMFQGKKFKLINDFEEKNITVTSEKELLTEIVNNIKRIEKDNKCAEKLRRNLKQKEQQDVNGEVLRKDEENKRIRSQPIRYDPVDTVSMKKRTTKNSKKDNTQEEDDEILWKTILETPPTTKSRYYCKQQEVVAKVGGTTAAATVEDIFGADTPDAGINTSGPIKGNSVADPAVVTNPAVVAATAAVSSFPSPSMSPILFEKDNSNTNSAITNSSNNNNSNSSYASESSSMFLSCSSNFDSSAAGASSPPADNKSDSCYLISMVKATTEECVLECFKVMRELRGYNGSNYNGQCYFEPKRITFSAFTNFVTRIHTDMERRGDGKLSFNTFFQALKHLPQMWWNIKEFNRSLPDSTPGDGLCMYHSANQSVQIWNNLSKESDTKWLRDQALPSNCDSLVTIFEKERKYLYEKLSLNDSTDNNFLKISIDKVDVLIKELGVDGKYRDKTTGNRIKFINSADACWGSDEMFRIVFVDSNHVPVIYFHHIPQQSMYRLSFWKDTDNSHKFIVTFADIEKMYKKQHNFCTFTKSHRHFYRVLLDDAEYQKSLKAFEDLAKHFWQIMVVNNNLIGKLLCDELFEDTAFLRSVKQLWKNGDNEWFSETDSNFLLSQNNTPSFRKKQVDEVNKAPPSGEIIEKVDVVNNNLPPPSGPKDVKIANSIRDIIKSKYKTCNDFLSLTKLLEELVSNEVIEIE